MANKTQQIKIESILGGKTPVQLFSNNDQFLDSLNIDPSIPVPTDFSASSTIRGLGATGAITPMAIHSAYYDLPSAPLWIKSNPKDDYLYVYCANGSVYTSGALWHDVIPDGGALSNSRGNGCAYYDNYMYFAKNTTIARYGPLNGVPAFNGDYWGTTLGKPALSDDAYYPATEGASGKGLFPNHILHRHGGRLYIADVVGNTGALHYIQTKKTTVEGDTDDGSTYDAVHTGYGLYPTAIESYGDQLAIGLFEGSTEDSNSNERWQVAKLAFWDTTSQKFNQISTNEFPDKAITSIINANGVLYIVSYNDTITSSIITSGFRVSRYIGGNSIQQVAYIVDADPPLPGSVISSGDRLLFGTSTVSPTDTCCVYSLGLQDSGISTGLFKVMGGTTTASATANSFYGYTAIAFNPTASISKYKVIAGYGDKTTLGGMDVQDYGYDYDTSHPIFRSQIYKIGEKFQINRVRLALSHPLQTGAILAVNIYTDFGQNAYSLGYITRSEGSSINLRKHGITGEHDFVLELVWHGDFTDGSSEKPHSSVLLPITIDYEITNT